MQVQGMIQHILVTGGAGYLGSVLTHDLIRQGYDVTVVDNLSLSTQSLLDLIFEPSFACEVIDIRYPSLVSPLLDEADAVVHLAAVGNDSEGCCDAEEIKRINLDATKSLYEESSRRGVKRFVFASTCSNYVPDGPDKPVDEATSLRPISPYGVSKVAAEEFILGYQSNATVPVILRFPEIYGLSYRNRFDIAINRLIKDAIRENRIEMRCEVCWRSYIHVLDASRAICAVIEADRDFNGVGVFNVGDDTQNFQMKTIAELIIKALPDVRCTFNTLKEDPTSYRVSFGKIRDWLGFSINHTLEESIPELFDAIDEGRVDFSEG
jgi:nucleoside-diphosphate-sugar epimerase